MATTTTIYVDEDASLRESHPTTNFGNPNILRTGQLSGSRGHGVFHFDISSFTVPSDIVNANFTLSTQVVSGAARTMKIARLNQDFVESKVTWNDAELGVPWTGGAGAEGNAEFTQPTYDFFIGADTGEQAVDIKELFIDAINRRESDLWLVLCFDPADSDTTVGFNVIGGSRQATVGNRPKILVTVADRIAWRGTVDGDGENALNWSGGVAPTASDYIYFDFRDNPVTTGYLYCHSCFIGKEWTGKIGDAEQGAAGVIYFSSNVADIGNKLVVNQEQGSFNLKERGNYERKVFIQNTSKDYCRFVGTTLEYYAFVDKTGGNLEFEGQSNLIMSSSKNSKRVTTDGIKTDIIANGKLLTLNNGCNDITLANGARVICKESVDGDLTITSGVFNQQGASVAGEVFMYGGEFNFKNNVNAESVLLDCYIWKGAFMNTKSESTNLKLDADFLLRGGNFNVDVGSLVTIVTA